MKFLLTLLSLVPLLAWSASFDCQNTRNATKHAICADRQLSRFDVQRELAVQEKVDASTLDAQAGFVQKQKRGMACVSSICQDTVLYLYEAYPDRRYRHE